MLVYVLNADGYPLMPSSRCAHIRHLLKAGRAKVVRQKPFTIQLCYETTNYTQPLCGGTDPGRTNIGEAVLDSKGNVLYSAHVETRNKEIPKLMEERKAHRQASRRGERKRRQRRACVQGTISFPLEAERLLPGYKKPIANKLISNTEVRFNNRKRPAGWLTPTANQLVQTHLSMVKKIKSILPVTDWVLEINKFAFMLMEDGTVRGVDFQNGRLKGYASMEDYVFASQDGKCPVCGEPIDHYHHRKPRSEGGSNRPENLVGLCKNCHEAVHKGALSLNKVGENKKYAALSVLNQAILYIYDGLVGIFGKGHVHTCIGWETKARREGLHLDKTHDSDAVCIASLGNNSYPAQCPTPYEVKQFRRHNRATIHSQRERTYKLWGITVAKNKHPRYQQQGPSLAEYLESWPPEYREYIRSKLTVTKSKRHYNTKGRLLPGTIFYYEGSRHVKSGQSSGGAAVLAIGAGRKMFNTKRCVFVPSGGLVYC